MTPPRFIVLDGMDGAGKSSQIAPLVAWLEARGLTVTTCRDPGATPAGDAIRAILLDRHVHRRTVRDRRLSVFHHLDCHPKYQTGADPGWRPLRILYFLSPRWSPLQK